MVVQGSARRRGMGTGIDTGQRSQSFSSAGRKLQTSSIHYKKLELINYTP